MKISILKLFIIISFIILLSVLFYNNKGYYLTMYNYYFAIASQNFLMNEEPLEEILRERTSHYKSMNKDIDFWLVLNPTFINLPELRSIKKQIIGESAAIISFDRKFIQWLKLRICFIATGDFQSQSLLEIESG